MKKVHYLSFSSKLGYDAVASIDDYFKKNCINNFSPTHAGEIVEQSQTFYDTKTRSLLKKGGFLRFTVSRSKKNFGAMRLFVEYKKDSMADVVAYEANSNSFSIDNVIKKLNLKGCFNAVLEASSKNERFNYGMIDPRLNFINAGVYVDVIMENITINPHSRDCCRKLCILTLSDKTSIKYGKNFAESYKDKIDKCFSLCDEVMQGYNLSKTTCTRYQLLSSLSGSNQLTIYDEPQNN